MDFSATTLSAENENVLEYAKNATKQGIKCLHIDFMDGKFVEHKTLSPKTFAEVFSNVDADIIVHIMAKNPKKYIKQFIKSGAKKIVFQIEASKNPLKLVNKFSNAVQIGVALDYNTPLTKECEQVLKSCNLALFMLTKAGKSGIGARANFANLEKIEKAKKINKNIYTIVDGGVTQETIPLIKSYKPNCIASGGFAYNLIKNNKLKAFLKTLKTL